MRAPRPVVFGVVLALALFAALTIPVTALAAGNDVGRNIGNTLRDAAASIYGGVVAVVGLVFLINRRYTELGLFFIAAICVGWLVFSPDQIADAARAIGQRILP